MEPHQPEHIPLGVLWETRTGLSVVGNDFDYAHLVDCERCIRLFGICQLAKSFEEAQRFAKEEFGE